MKAAYIILGFLNLTFVFLPPILSWQSTVSLVVAIWMFYLAGQKK